MIEEIAVRYSQLDYVEATQVSESNIIVDINLEGATYTLDVNLSNPFPNTLPQIKLLKADEHGYLPHVCWKGIVCYNDGEGVSIDYERPIDIAVYALDSATGVLPKKPNISLDDFYDEYEGYWNQQNDAVDCQLFFEPGDETKEIRIVENKNGMPVSIISSDSAEKPTSGYACYKLRNSNKA